MNVLEVVFERVHGYLGVEVWVLLVLQKVRLLEVLALLEVVDRFDGSLKKLDLKLHQFFLVEAVYHRISEFLINFRVIEYLLVFLLGCFESVCVFFIAVKEFLAGGLAEVDPKGVRERSGKVRSRALF